MEDAGDDGEMPQLEGAEEDASRMEEVVKLLIMSLKCTAPTWVPIWGPRSPWGPFSDFRSPLGPHFFSRSPFSLVQA